MIREIRASDEALYLELVRQFYSSPAVDHPVDEANFHCTFKELMRSREYMEGFILERDGEPAGYALIAKSFSPEAGGPVVWIEEIYILPRFRSMGLGGEFFSFIHERYRGWARRFRLEVSAGNDGAARLYARLGYKPLPYGQMVLDLPESGK